MKVVQILPDGHRMKKEVDMALDTVSETMTPMHYHLREIIICTYRQVRLMLFCGKDRYALLDIFAFLHNSVLSVLHVADSQCYLGMNAS